MLLLSYASIRFTVMQAVMASSPMSPTHLGAGMAEMAPAPIKAVAPHHHGKPTSSRPAACPYCSAAAHLPVLTGLAFLRAPVAFTFAAFRVVASHSARGPPSLQPRARGPPSGLLPL